MASLPYFKDSHMGPGLLGALDLREFKQEFLLRYGGRISPNKHVLRNPNETDQIIDLWNRRYSSYVNYGYTSNSWGLRGAEPQSSVRMEFWGCSETWGLGNPEGARWCDHLARDLAVSSNNWGVCGISCEEIVNLYIGTRSYFTSEISCVLFPDIHRKTIPYVHEQDGVSIGYYMMTVSQARPRIDSRFLGRADQVELDANDYLRISSMIQCDQFKQQVLIMARWAKLHKQRLILGSWNKVTAECLTQIHAQTRGQLFELVPHVSKTDIARDGSHMGMSSHLAWAQSFSREINHVSNR